MLLLEKFDSLGVLSSNLQQRKTKIFLPVADNMILPSQVRSSFNVKFILEKKASDILLKNSNDKH